MKSIYVMAFGINQLESWSKVLFEMGLTYRIEGDIQNGNPVFAIQIDAQGHSKDELTLKFLAKNESVLVK